MFDEDLIGGLVKGTISTDQSRQVVHMFQFHTVLDHRLGRSHRRRGGRRDGRSSSEFGNICDCVIGRAGRDRIVVGVF